MIGEWICVGGGRVVHTHTRVSRVTIRGEQVEVLPVVVVVVLTKGAKKDKKKKVNKSMKFSFPLGLVY